MITSKHNIKPEKTAKTPIANQSGYKRTHKNIKTQIPNIPKKPKRKSKTEFNLILSHIYSITRLLKNFSGE